MVLNSLKKKIGFTLFFLFLSLFGSACSGSNNINSLPLINFGEDIIVSDKKLYSYKIEVEETRIITINLLADPDRVIGVGIYNEKGKEIFKVERLYHINIEEIVIAEGIYKLEIYVTKKPDNYDGNNKAKGWLIIDVIENVMDIELDNKISFANNQTSYLFFTPEKNGLYALKGNNIPLPFTCIGNKWAIDNDAGLTRYVYLEGKQTHAIRVHSNYGDTLTISEYNPILFENNEMICTASNIYAFTVSETTLYKFTKNDEKNGTDYQPNAHLCIYSLDERVLDSWVDEAYLFLEAGKEYYIKIYDDSYYNSYGNTNTKISFEKAILDNKLINNFPLAIKVDSFIYYNFSVDKSDYYSFSSNGSCYSFSVFVYYEMNSLTVSGGTHDSKKSVYLEKDKSYILRLGASDYCHSDDDYSVTINLKKGK